MAKEKIDQIDQKDLESVIEYKGKKIPVVFNLNVMQNIQIEFGSFDKWAQLTAGDDGKEIDMKALIFGLCEMMNEGIDIENEEKGTNEPLLTLKQAGRIITAYGIANSTNVMQKTVIDASKDDSSKNA